MIEINDLYKYYGERKAIGPLSFTIETGEIVGLLGLNGAGKTTTLRILACDLLPSSGSVRVDGIDVVDRPHEVRARIGYLPDTPPLYGEMTVRDYLRFAARLRGMSRADAEKRLPEVEEVTQLDRVSGDPITSLSHGFRQRVGIAQAIVHRPRLLVLDEPITGLDPVQIVEMRELLKGLRGNHTILLSSHILSEISETCDRILVIRDGEIGASGTEAELSATLLSAVRVEITLRADASGDPKGGARERASAIARSVEGVTNIDVLPPSEPGEDVCTLRVAADRDVREALCRAFVGAGFGILAVKRSERELESVFLRLAKGSRDGVASAAAANVAARPDTGADTDRDAATDADAATGADTDTGMDTDSDDGEKASSPASSAKGGGKDEPA